ncbi:MAG TPA: AsmA-like C-terminal region-containing protein [Rhodocyclaceae bacterium]|nr:AsmA-like C-terminal region-containing protein [Rhodocyclaceae bacterium]HNC61158.1 AsmA-like C-terminal region-containing protein [Rhodocyclaceae bacterium]
MNDDQIYCKTPEGERALLQRTRLVQRNLRNVLILVDGATNVAELTRKLGDGGFLRASLGELVRGGFIETLEEHRVRRGLEAANAPEGEPKTVPVPDPVPPKPIELPPQVDSVLPEHSGWRVEPKIDLDDLEDEIDDSPVAEAAPVVAAPARSAPFWKRWFTIKPRSVERVVAPAAPAAEESLAPSTVPRPPRKIRIKKIRRGQDAQPFRWKSHLARALLVLLVAAVVGVVLFPYDRYRGEVERRASAWLGQPVSIGSMRLALSAEPGIVLEQVRVGASPGVAVGSLRVIPNVTTLGGPSWKLGTVVLERPVIDQNAILALLDERRTPSVDTLQLQRVRVERATVSISGMSLDDVTGDILLTPDAGISEIRLNGGNGAVSVVAVPEGKHALKLTLGSTAWRLPLAGGVPVESIDAQAVLTRDALRADKFDLRVFDGVMSGSATVQWAQRVDLSIQGKFERIGLQRLFAMVEPAARIQGTAGGRLSLRGNGESFAGALRALSGSGPFKVDNGVFQGFDLVEAVRNSRSEIPVRGGDIRLEELEGSVSFEGGKWRLGGLRGHSGALAAFGHLNQAGGKLEGAMDVQLRGSANQVNVPVSISGTLSDPVLKGRRGGGTSADAAAQEPRAQ